jgi:hypothetical protein
MSFSAHKRDALDSGIPLNHRVSHLRSCAMLMGQKYRVSRSTILDRVRELCGVDISAVGDEADVQRAVDVLARIKELGLDGAMPAKED